jgi:hypothetical protein
MIAVGMEARGAAIGVAVTVAATDTDMADNDAHSSR